MSVGKLALIELDKEHLDGQGKDPERSGNHIDKMVKEGVIWKREEGEVYGTGIPSFLGYITERVKRVEKELAEARGLER